MKGFEGGFECEEFFVVFNKDIFVLNGFFVDVL